MRFFNTAGPCKSNKHYMVPPLERFDLEDLEMLIDQEKYFVLHAPRQTGKTTCMLALMEHLNRENRYKVLYVNVEAAQAARENVAAGIQAIVAEIGSRARINLKDDFIQKIRHQVFKESNEYSALNEVLSLWAENSSKPVVLIIDEIDSLVGDTLISVLRQIRSGYDMRPLNFPQSIIFCGVRDIRDYRIHSDKDKTIVTGGSAFNIKAKSLRLGEFVKEEVNSLLIQHTKETGQKFTQKAMESIWEYTLGQPWLVSALAYEVCFEIKEGRNRACTIIREMIENAKENLILRRETHLDQLADKLKEKRVRRVVEPVLSGMHEASSILEDDMDYVCDLGLVRRKPNVTISNPIYHEIIPRMLTSATQDMIPFETLWYVAKDKSLDMGKLLKAFQKFFREHSEHWIERFDYKGSRSTTAAPGIFTKNSKQRRQD